MQTRTSLKHGAGLPSVSSLKEMLPFLPAAKRSSSDHCHSCRHFANCSSPMLVTVVCWHTAEAAVCAIIMQSCVCFQHILSFSQAGVQARMLVFVDMLAFVSMCVCTCASPCVYLQSYSFNIILFHQILFEMIWYECIRNALLLYPWGFTFEYDAIPLCYLIYLIFTYSI